MAWIAFSFGLLLLIELFGWAELHFGDGNNSALCAISGVPTSSLIGADDCHPDVPCIAFLLVVSRLLLPTANKPTC